MTLPSRGRAPRVSLVPYGLNEQHPNHYVEMFKVLRDNRDNLGYAWRILRDGCCDGCSLGTSGMYDWTMKGIHLCNVRLQLLRLNTMPAMDHSLLERVDTLRGRSEKQLRKLGRLAYPTVGRRGDAGFRRISWDAVAVIGLCYGGGFGTMPSFTADFFGARNMGGIYGWILLAWGAAAIPSPLLMAHLRETTGSFTDAIRIIAIVLTLSIGLPLLAKRPLRGVQHG